MASAQVLRKQNLEAGKKKLEEFRKKKAAEKAKKAASTDQVQASEGGLSERQHSESERIRLVVSDAAGTFESDSVGATFPEPFGVAINSDLKETRTSQKSSYGSAQDASFSPFDSAINIDIGSAAPIQSHMPNKEFGGGDTLHISEQLNGHYNLPVEKKIGRTSESAPSRFPADPPGGRLPSGDTDSTSNQSGFHGQTSPHDGDVNLNTLSVIKSSGSSVYQNGFPEKSGNNLLHDKPGYGNRFLSSLPFSSYEDPTHSARSNTNYYSEVGQRMGPLESSNSAVPDLGESRNVGSGQVASTTALSPWSTDSTYAISSSYGQAGTNIRRSRPPFLEPINISKGPSPAPQSEPVKVEPFSSKVFPENTVGSASSMFSSVTGVNLFMQDNKRDRYSQKQDEDFAALEQHIEDLTQEKFSLQRALEASRTLAESLASENSALIENYNQQGSVVSQLKFEMQTLQEEIKVNLVELKSVKMEYSNAQMEYNAADERAKLLASEVIGLEEKALRLRSNELKLERHLEESLAEISSFKKKMSSLEKERQDLHSTIDALQEEKKLLQSELRKASAGGKLLDIPKSQTNKKDVSTSTEDLGETSNADFNRDNSDMEGYHQLPHGNRQFSIQDLSLAIPPDQIRMIENITTLISELTLEKEELVRALSTESSQSSKLKELNKDLTQKLEIQTQKLELLTSQSMVTDGSLARHPNVRTIHENTPQYADEGDEVVERVLGWIMKLFPGGPSRRQTSKLL